jgi:hypothetical protein
MKLQDVEGDEKRTLENVISIHPIMQIISEKPIVWFVKAKVRKNQELNSGLM